MTKRKGTIGKKPLARVSKDLVPRQPDDIRAGKRRILTEQMERETQAGQKLSSS